MHGCACERYIFWSYDTSTFTAMRSDEKPFTCQCEKENKKGLRVSDFTFYWSFSSDVMAVKGLINPAGLLPWPTIPS